MDRLDVLPELCAAVDTWRAGLLGRPLEAGPEDQGSALGQLLQTERTTGTILSPGLRQRKRPPR